MNVWMRKIEVLNITKASNDDKRDHFDVGWRSYTRPLMVFLTNGGRYGVYEWSDCVIVFRISYPYFLSDFENDRLVDLVLLNSIRYYKKDPVFALSRYEELESATQRRMELVL